MAAESGEGAVDLFGEHGAGQLMRERHGGKGQENVGARLPLGGKAIMSADQEYEIASVAFGLTNELNESSGVEIPAGRIEEDLTGGGLTIKQVEALGDNLPHFAHGVTAATLQELGGDGVCVRVARFPNVINEDLQVFSIRFPCIRLTSVTQ